MSAKEQGANIYPLYREIATGKDECCPEGITLQPSRDEVSLQALVNHTAHRIITLQEDVIRQAAGERESITVELTCKWGFDGATAQSSYKQTGTPSPTEDNQVLFTSLVPLQLTAGNDLIWHSRTTSSSRFTRPMKLEYCRETARKSREEAAYWREQISQFKQYQLQMGGLTVSVTFRLLLTMIDGKVQAAITETSPTAVCTVCRAKPSQFNHLQQVRLMSVSKSALMLGLSNMHAWIRFLEFIVHLSCKAEEGVKRWTGSAQSRKKSSKKRRESRTCSGRGWDCMLIRRGLEEQWRIQNVEKGRPSLLNGAHFYHRGPTYPIRFFLSLPLNRKKIARKCRKLAVAHHIYIKQF